MLRNGICFYFNDISLYPPTTNGNRLEVVFLCQLARRQPHIVLSFVYIIYIRRLHCYCCRTWPKCIYTCMEKFARPNRIYSVEKRFKGFFFFVQICIVISTHAWFVVCIVCSYILYIYESRYIEYS